MDYCEMTAEPWDCSQDIDNVFKASYDLQKKKLLTQRKKAQATELKRWIRQLSSPVTCVLLTLCAALLVIIIIAIVIVSDQVVNRTEQIINLKLQNLSEAVRSTEEHQILNDTSHQAKAPQDEPPIYNHITPYAPPVTCPPSAPLNNTIVKGLPPGMEPLLQINQLTVKEKFSVSQGYGSFYDVLNHLGQRLFQADQNYEWCGPVYDVSFRDNSGNAVLQLLNNQTCSFNYQMWVLSPPGSAIGFVILHTSCPVTHLSVMDSSKEVLLLILGPSFHDSIFGNATYEVKSRDEQHVVGIIKMETDRVLVSFPLDMDVAVKALLLGSSLFLNNIIKRKRRDLERQARSNS